MNLTCERCSASFEADDFLGYCPDCRDHFRGERGKAHDRANPAPGVHCTGKFLEGENCPRTVFNPVSGRNVCGLCGGGEIDQGYGFAGGYGLGVYNFCLSCNAVLDFSPDSGE